jgi:hypothetical protein
MFSSSPTKVTKQQLISTLQRQNLKEVLVFEPLDEVRLAELRKLKKDEKTTVVVLRGR